MFTVTALAVQIIIYNVDFWLIMFSRFGIGYDLGFEGSIEP